eukprot:gnl/MRDRNA2_/MRDRNA2_44696_c0_seq1.p1 gnl/MRDRNA2_/MRDRNA2_44696_c0~~gnl/MRDRNA2_/MRDRNA2_44696_c0_seq1.p1  ORF type:complete len:499 (+),score=135.93 gnl/MRDRNA2_/MRDRNA2_44696_c0_seq1:125-1621(+)
MHQVRRYTVAPPQAQRLQFGNQLHRSTVAHFQPQLEPGQITLAVPQSQPAGTVVTAPQSPPAQSTLTVPQTQPYVQFAQAPVNQPPAPKAVSNRAPSYRELVARLDDAEAEAKHWVLEVDAKADEAKILKEELQEEEKNFSGLQKQETILRTELEELKNEGQRFLTAHEVEVKENIDAMAAATNAAERLQMQISEFEVADAELSMECRQLDNEAEVFANEVTGIKAQNRVLLEEAAEADSVLDGLNEQFEERQRHVQVIVAARQREQVERQFLSELLTATHARIEAVRSELGSQEEISKEEAVNGWQNWQASCSNGAGEVEALRCELQLAHELLRRRTEERDNWRKIAYQSELHLRSERGDDVVQGLKQLTASCSFHGVAASVGREASWGVDDAQTKIDATHQDSQLALVAGLTNGSHHVDHLPHADQFGVHGAVNAPWQHPHINSAGAHAIGNVPEFVTPPPNMQPELPLLPLPPLPAMDWPPSGPAATGPPRPRFP